jgi:hypothetical protein
MSALSYCSQGFLKRVTLYRGAFEVNFADRSFRIVPPWWSILTVPGVALKDSDDIPARNLLRAQLRYSPSEKFQRLRLTFSARAVPSSYTHCMVIGWGRRHFRPALDGNH